jgi:2-polyprenyl-3-methyl-5-hydroxy-6-metoxy-1,4-benzoquinol methylase
MQVQANVFQSAVVKPESSLQKIINGVLQIWPEHENYVQRGLRDRNEDEIEDTHLLADLIVKVAGSQLLTYIENYRWLCAQFLEEEIHFVRTGNYRFTRLSEVQDRVYNNHAYMKQYMDGLLVSQVFWSNHARSFSFLKRRYLGQLQQGFRHLEIGPGHGLFTYLAAATPGVQTVSAWDISATSLKETYHCLKALGIESQVQLEQRDAMANAHDLQKYDSIVMSEILEHVERPVELLSAVKNLLSENGKIFINVPVNSPAPDHIYLLRSTDEAVQLAESAGLKVQETAFFPQTGMRLEHARTRSATISSLLICSRA